jgi:hypothetical protein
MSTKQGTRAPVSGPAANGAKSAAKCGFSALGGSLRRSLDDEMAGRELNPRHADFQSAALPTELPGPTERRIKQARPQIVNE